MQPEVIPSSFRIEPLRANKAADHVNKEMKDYRLQTEGSLGVSLEYTGINTPQQLGMPKPVGKNLATMVRHMLTESGLPKFI